MGKNNKIIIVNMMMMMTTNPEYLATEDLAIAKSSVAISSAHHDGDDGDDIRPYDDNQVAPFLVPLLLPLAHVCLAG